MSKHKMIVAVERQDTDGSLFSEIRADPPVMGLSVVIDRESRRGPINADALVGRAKRVAEILDIPYKEDFAWHCCAMKKLPCRCPQCTKTTYA